jgi:hypothetical protein
VPGVSRSPCVSLYCGEDIDLTDTAVGLVLKTNGFPRD